ncbi:MAG: transposase [Candidatus Omnitrophica bacterium]|nr:transposase [Candidatus Omnitrophota bacterium]
MVKMIQYYRQENPSQRFSRFIERRGSDKKTDDLRTLSSNEKALVEIISYCIMPTHFHLVLTQMKDGGISIFVNNLLNSYTRYFNTKLKRKGPLWESRFKSVFVGTDEQLLHLTRYIHLNPVTAYLVDQPEDWGFSSYNEYVGNALSENKICEYDNVLDITPSSYGDFVKDRISYQRSLGWIKNVALEETQMYTA